MKGRGERPPAEEEDCLSEAENGAKTGRVRECSVEGTARKEVVKREWEGKERKGWW